MSYLLQVTNQRPMLRVTAKFFRILLCSAAGAGVFKSCGFRPAIGHTL